MQVVPQIRTTRKRKCGLRSGIKSRRWPQAIIAERLLGVMAEEHDASNGLQFLLEWRRSIGGSRRDYAGRCWLRRWSALHHRFWQQSNGRESVDATGETQRPDAYRRNFGQHLWRLGVQSPWDIMLEPGFTRHRTPTETNSLSDAALVADPFHFFGPADLHNHNGSTYAAQHRNTLLAEMVPARTRPAGANRVESRGFVPLSGEDRNFNMNATFQNGWPSSRNSTRWLHSDVNNVGYPYTWKLFSRFVDLGGLDQ